MLWEALMLRQITTAAPLTVVSSENGRLSQKTTMLLDEKEDQKKKTNPWKPCVSCILGTILTNKQIS